MKTVLTIIFFGIVFKALAHDIDISKGDIVYVFHETHYSMQMPIYRELIELDSLSTIDIGIDYILPNGNNLKITSAQNSIDYTCVGVHRYIYIRWEVNGVIHDERCRLTKSENDLYALGTIGPYKVGLLDYKEDRSKAESTSLHQSSTTTTPITSLNLIISLS